ncbi:transcription factor MYB23-like [Punica granatum]|uniref:Uncharacterized protein n=2 Tax=Punica granatum TaxID=22663 RepID=A0A218XH82_PUNGR|nr:transcription factor MYB23-like [Punica granatum]OWM84110.1 hypothetical protein CDL15_Pgr009357 [Punica granatum]PKI52440.1 hypothetical protein CRG98_027170 [Punica granatum]
MRRNPSPTRSKEELSKGAWTATEDQILIDFVKNNGEGRWERVSKQTGLRRCGKSCRLRWLNYLRPDIKRGNISEDEEELIIRLHKLLGNRWSLIAKRLPGRTDNEIKNYWNSILRKKLQLGGKQSEYRNPKKNIATKDPCNEVSPTMANVQGPPVDHSLTAASLDEPEGSMANATVPEAKGPTTLQVAGDEKDGCPSDFMVNHKLCTEICPSDDFMELCTQIGPKESENRFDQMSLPSSSNNLQDSELSEEMLFKWAADLMDS